MSRAKKASEEFVEKEVMVEDEWFEKRFDKPRRLMKVVLNAYLEIGRLMNQLTEELDDDEWEKWLDFSFGLSNSQSAPYMMLAKLLQEVVDDDVVDDAVRVWQLLNETNKRGR